MASTKSWRTATSCVVARYWPILDNVLNRRKQAITADKVATRKSYQKWFEYSPVMFRSCDAANVSGGDFEFALDGENGHIIVELVVAKLGSRVIDTIHELMSR